MKDAKIQPCWDAKRLLQEFLKMASLIHFYQEKPFGDMAWSNQIRVRRIASALSAFMGLKESEENPIPLIMSVFSDWDFEHLFEVSPLHEEDHAKILALVKDLMNDDHRYESLTRMSDYYRDDPAYMERKKMQEREHMLHVLLEYRKDAEKLVSHFDGMMEGTVGVYLCVLAVRRSCLEPLKRSNEKIDDIIVMLLGDKFKQSFSEEELKANYGYPKETDHELDEWDCDNM